MSNEIQSINNSNSQIYNNSQNVDTNKKVNKRSENIETNRLEENKSQKSQSKDQVTLSDSEKNSSDNTQQNISKINEFGQLVSTRLKFSVDNESEETVIYVIDKNSDKVIRSIPPQHLSDLAGKLEDIKNTMI